VEALSILGRLAAFIGGTFLEMFLEYKAIQSGYWSAALVVLLVGGIATGLGFYAGGMWGYIWLGITIAAEVFIISGGVSAHVNSGKRVQ
jgi:hypothetical protein